MRKLLIFVLVLIVLVVGVDIGGRALAESKAGDAVAGKTGGVAPSVDIHGMSFLLQAVPGHYSHITLTSNSVVAGPITGIAAIVDLYTVDFPLSDALKGDTSHLTADQGRLVGQIAAGKIAALLPQAGVRISAGPDGSIRLATTVSVAGQKIPLTADLVTSFESGSLHLDAENLDAAGIALPNVAGLQKNLSLVLPLKGLPFAVESADLTASGSNLVLTATAKNIAMGATT
ncbi:Protein of unknown function [Nakamurella panacisegetis]|uniref:DUF2993 domain-containing protein n=1 Tax=Nakamurella panacisegetis TaxID=1090615 RepID=A0A1H0JM69_9ACTN|nr:DUF2993 domain-containing protein [Nakamurella panacisegetis]SDO44724.1 Protein of unknown function [Nakamurella panacisegetis]